jgi:hypothetical protein
LWRQLFSLAMNLSTGSVETIRRDLGQFITNSTQLNTLEIGTDLRGANHDY